MVIASTLVAGASRRPLAPGRPKADKKQGRIVLGYAPGYDLNAIAPFIRALRSVYSGRVILVVDSDPTLRAYLNTHAVEMETAPRWTPLGRHPLVACFSAFADILDREDDRADVLLVDVMRDAFHRDPFDGLTQELQVFAASGEGPIGENPRVLKYVRRLAGERRAPGLAGKTCLDPCAVAGPSTEVARFCRLASLLCRPPRFGRSGVRAACQAVFSLIAHLNLVETRTRTPIC